MPRDEAYLLDILIAARKALKEEWFVVSFFNRQPGCRAEPLLTHDEPEETMGIE